MNFDFWTVASLIGGIIIGNILVTVWLKRRRK